MGLAQSCVPDGADAPVMQELWTPSAGNLHLLSVSIVSPVTPFELSEDPTGWESRQGVYKIVTGHDQLQLGGMLPQSCTTAGLTRLASIFAV